MSTLMIRNFTLLVVLGFLLAAPLSASALTSDGCLAQKRKIWGNLRKCQSDVAVKQLAGKPADPTKCTTKFSGKLAKVSQKASSLAIECCYADDGAGTVLDYDTGLQWEKKDGADGVVNMNNPGSASSAGLRTAAHRHLWPAREWLSVRSRRCYRPRPCLSRRSPARRRARPRSAPPCSA